MSKIIITCILIFSLLAAGFAYIFIASQENNTSLPMPFAGNPSPTPSSMISLTLSAEHPMVVKQQSNTITVVLDAQKTKTTKLKLIQMEIAYDPNALSDVTVTPGEFFVNPVVPLSIINTHSGRISYALSVNNEESSPYTPSMVVARLTFTPNPAFQGTDTSLSFLGKTMIRAAKDENILTATYGTRLFFASSSATPQF